MSLSVGIVGLPNVGKSTVFNALVTRAKAKVGQYPFTTVDKNIGSVNVPDETLFDLAKVENIEKVTPAQVEIVDIAGLIKGAHAGEGLGNQFLHHIREVELILHLVRFFQDENIPHVHAKIDPVDDVEIINDELILADLETLDRRLKKEKVSVEEKIVLEKFIRELNAGKLASEVSAKEGELEFVKPINLLTSKKQVLLANIGEVEIKNPPKEIKGQPTLSICAKLEAELAEFPWTEQQRFLKEYGLSHSAKDQIIKTIYEALDVLTFYTIAKRKEARAWTLRRGQTALDAAGKVHTDFAENFIKAEVISVDELLELGGWNKAKEKGKVRLEGRDYLVQDGDVIEFKVGIK